MKYEQPDKSKPTDVEHLIEFATQHQCYITHQYSKALHKQLIEKADGWQKGFVPAFGPEERNSREYWKEKDDEWTLWRIVLR